MPVKKTMTKPAKAKTLKAPVKKGPSANASPRAHAAVARARARKGARPGLAATQAKKSVLMAKVKKAKGQAAARAANQRVGNTSAPKPGMKPPRKQATNPSNPGTGVRGILDYIDFWNKN